jgi:3',5'-cyclic AMP phosphodiesterase CpdA
MASSNTDTTKFNLGQRLLGLLFLISAVVLGTVPVTLATETVNGTVFDDRNGDSLRDEGEPGVPGVLVSNGLDVVPTDSDGRYRLDLDERELVFVTKPAGWAVPLSEDNLPQFFYRYYPSGTPAELGLRYPGPEPSGSLDGPIDFPLRRVEEPDTYEVIWFSDPQPQTPAEIDYIRDDVIAELVGTRAAFGITVGDIMYDDLALFPRYNEVVGQVGIPWYNVPGNHDMNFQAGHDRDSLETFKRYFGPPYYSFEYGQVHFVVLDTVDYLGRDAQRGRLGRTYEGRVSERQIAWLENDLEHVPTDRLVVLAMHIPLRSLSDRKSSSINVANLPDLLDVIGGREKLFAVAGHMHNNEHHYFTKEDGLDSQTPLHLHTLAAVSGSWWSGPFDERGIPVAVQSDGSPNGYHVMSVGGTDVRMRYQAAGKPADYQMRVTIEPASDGEKSRKRRGSRKNASPDGRVALDRVGSSQVVVNLFDGGPNSRVEYRIGERAPVSMHHVHRQDRYVKDLYRRNKATKKRWVQAARCLHLWEADLPADLGPGIHTIRVEAVDEYGQRHEAHKVLEIVSP